jgi:hypothetical protein|tara:strand:+ start:56 stop:331 length:276 start_codon:yes stop_codon:yes gene_type:complete
MATEIKLLKKEEIEVKMQKQYVRINDEETFIIYDYFSNDGNVIENSIIHNESGEMITSEDTGGVFIADVYNFLDELADEEEAKKEQQKEKK